jgi:hypothetical protein
VVLDAFVMAHLGFQPAVAVTTVTAQNSSAFLGQWPVAPETLVAQLDALLAEGDIACVKIGALGSAELAGALAEWLILAEVPVVVCDPVSPVRAAGRLWTSPTEAVDALARASSVDAQRCLRRCVPPVWHRLARSPRSSRLSFARAHPPSAGTARSSRPVCPASADEAVDRSFTPTPT